MSYTHWYGRLMSGSPDSGCGRTPKFRLLVGPSSFSCAMSSRFRSVHVRRVGRDHHRVVGRREARSLRLHVDAEVALDRGPAVAEQIVRARRSAATTLFQFGTLGIAVEVPRRHEAAGRHRTAPGIDELK